MPIYAYRCDACGHAQDVLQKISDPLLSTCPNCGAQTYKKQLTAAGFQLKGSGWYATDFKNNTPAPPPTTPDTTAGTTSAGSAPAPLAPAAPAPATKPDSNPA
jgi:putative FmdB family regulatory protein